MFSALFTMKVDFCCNFAAESCFAIKQAFSIAKTDKVSELKSWLKEKQ